MRNFRELDIWKESLLFVNDIYKIIDQFPSKEKFGLVSQMSRSAVSIPSNIAEGCRGSNKELIQFLNIALGSSFELETQIEISKNIGYIDQIQYDELIAKINTLQRRINAFRSSVK